MPKEAIRLGAAEIVSPLMDIPDVIMNYLGKKNLKINRGA